MKYPDEIELILSDRVTGSVELLNNLIEAFELQLKDELMDKATFKKLVISVRKRLRHFAAIENFLITLLTCFEPQDPFPGKVLSYFQVYRSYWNDSLNNIAENLLYLSPPEGKTILTHSHSRTVISLLENLQFRKVSFRVVQTVSSPGEEGRRSLEIMQNFGIKAKIVDDSEVHKLFREIDLVLMGCDTLLTYEFLNKIGTRSILETAKRFKVPTYLVTESRKEIKIWNWKQELPDHPLFEWTPLNLISEIITEKQL